MGTKKYVTDKSKIKELQQESIILEALNKILEEKLRKKQEERDETETHAKKEMAQENIILKEMASYDLFSNVKRHERRSKLELYYDILFTISQESIRGQVKPTRVQFLANTTYDRLVKYLDVLKLKGLITLNPIALTEKGRQLVTDYERVNHYNKKMGSNYL